MAEDAAGRAREAGPLLFASRPPEPVHRRAVSRRALAAAALLLPALALAALALPPRKRAALSAATAQGRRPGRPLDTLDELPSGYADQQGAAFNVGQALRIYAVGSSNTVWVPWLEQLHLLLGRLGFQLPQVPATEKALTRPLDVPQCEDSAEYASLQTTRIGQPGWGSWGFAFEGREGCSSGFRWIAGRPVSCRPAWGCPADSPQPLSLSRIAIDASMSDVTVLSCWINDSKQFITGNTCYNHTKLPRVDTAAVSIANLLRMIRFIHGRNPEVWVVVLALYPDERVPPHDVDQETLPLIKEINRRVREGLSDEPRTLFADYSFPSGVNLFQTLHSGHPNCRGAKLMANGVVDTLFRAGILGRGLSPNGNQACPAAGAQVHCPSLGLACCQRAALCRVVAGVHCADYGPGT
mmetsp:Transcript_80723/g.250567  ORF Transcript_80723/g.250567 Transcript_80723/m.250567 type:complete len:411 (+) Transcript_80723:105-1337(+)